MDLRVPVHPGVPSRPRHRLHRARRRPERALVRPEPRPESDPRPPLQRLWPRERDGGGQRGGKRGEARIGHGTRVAGAAIFGKRRVRFSAPLSRGGMVR
ncbi:hypothetical protein Rumeso_01936 [Rubellimicrobium mesophilum DSM 19309]|uniref:Uncharacterized protein n=1 Tax=Rubellimicrobium mesophilum DSM 19309 TaxID=442562 RepID=A0A017HQD0_9RHOB|nr:hypothetical protein Rumeso_01936 [Rubellimicrobium mesophilum DSM 19309]